MNRYLATLVLSSLGFVPWFFWAKAQRKYWHGLVTRAFAGEAIDFGREGFPWRMLLIMAISAVLFGPAVWSSGVIVLRPTLAAEYVVSLLSMGFIASFVVLCLSAWWKA